MTEKDLMAGKLSAGALIHYRGLPFYIAGDVKVLGLPANLELAEMESKRALEQEDPLNG